jgi:hypothetical protein
MRKVMITLAGVAGLAAVGRANAHEHDFLRRWIAISGKVLPPKDQTFLIGMVAHQMGSNDTCPRYRVVWPALRKDLDEVGFVPNEQKALEAMVLVDDMIKHDDDRSQLRREAWELFGPDGTYKRQMLEAQ